jgi:hypothetical protein
LDCLSARAKDSQASILEQINNARRKNVIRTYYREIDRLLLCEAKKQLNLRKLHRNVPADVRGSGVSRCDEDLIDPGRLTNFPSERMFTAAAADHQNFHTSYRTEGTYTVVVAGSWDWARVKRFPLIRTTLGWRDSHSPSPRSGTFDEYAVEYIIGTMILG